MVSRLVVAASSLVDACTPGQELNNICPWHRFGEGVVRKPKREILTEGGTGVCLPILEASKTRELDPLVLNDSLDIVGISEAGSMGKIFGTLLFLDMKSINRTKWNVWGQC